MNLKMKRKSKSKNEWYHTHKSSFLSFLLLINCIEWSSCSQLMKKKLIKNCMRTGIRIKNLQRHWRTNGLCVDCCCYIKLYDEIFMDLETGGQWQRVNVIKSLIFLRRIGNNWKHFQSNAFHCAPISVTQNIHKWYKPNYEYKSKV